MVPRYILRLVSAVFLFNSLLTQASAATNPVFNAAITWQANTIVPSWYTGKTLPNFHAPITASVLMTVNNQIANLRDYTISWRVAGDIVSTGRGMSRITIDSETSLSSLLRVQATIKNDAGETVANPVTTVERSYPKVVIDSPVPQRKVFAVPVTLNALPFFFSLTDLANLETSWLVDGVLVSTSPSLTVAATENALPTVRVEAQVENSSNNLESAHQAITLFPTL